MAKTRIIQRKIASTRTSLSDMINNLPDAVIETILVKLPTRDAIRTAILSRKWRYRWAKLPQFVFDDALWDTLVVEHSAKITFAMILYHFMSNHKGPVLKFILSVPDLEICPEIDNLIMFLSLNNIEDLTIEMWNTRYSLPSSIFTCQQLKRLSLKNCGIGCAFALKGFSKLTSLKLNRFSISDEVLRILISESPLLELLDICMYSGINIYLDAPNLRTFSFDGFAKSIIIRTARLLASVSLRLRGPDDWPVTCSLAKHLNGLPAVESLCFNYRTIHKSFVVADLGDYTTLVHLKHLNLSSISFNKVIALQFLLRLMRGSQKLNSIEIQFENDKNFEAKAKASTIYLEDEDYSCIWLSELKEVTLSDINGTKPEVEFIKLLLAKSPTLRKLRIKPAAYVDDSYAIVTEVIKFERVSKEAQVFYG